jgi:uncharacterized membrane protein YfbV (UPF0208 family)
MDDDFMRFEKNMKTLQKIKSQPNFQDFDQNLKHAIEYRLQR